MPTFSRRARCSASMIGDHQRLSHSVSRSAMPYFSTSGALCSYHWGRSQMRAS